ncbi:YxiJ family protein [Paenibacillus ihuae]|uniref:YxiJ family protein n=1 Tax=Paenibacillus ihuae TaxID=1232431 RepID=UPI0006D5378A|nr:YxiJ family protein [Paenibacillus ihuae]
MIYLLQQSDKQQWYFEVDDEGIAYRQMLLEEGKESKTSNVKKHEFFLAEHELPLDDPELKRIPKEAFEAVWDEMITEQQPRWLENKKTLPLGTTIMGYLEVLYPQGVIVSIPDTEALGLADYDECAAQSQQRNIHKGLLVEAQITGYDEVNCWFLLGQPRVWGGAGGDMDVSHKPEIVQELAQMYKTQLNRSFPYLDSKRLKEDYAESFAQLDGECFSSDFSEYCAVIAGTVSYVVNDHTAGIPGRQLELLKKSFFERFPQYCFIKTSLSCYPSISIDLENHERARGLLLSFLQNH